MSEPEPVVNGVGGASEEKSDEVGEGLSAKYVKSQKEIESLRAELAETTKTTQVQNIIDENQTLKQQVDSLKAALEVVQSSDSRLQGLEKELQTERNKVKGLQGELKGKEKARQAALEKQSKDLASQAENAAASLKAELQTVNEKLRAATRKRAQAQAQLASANEQLAKEKGEAQAKAKLVDELREELAGVTAVKVKAEEVAEVKTKAHELAAKKLEETTKLLEQVTLTKDTSSKRAEQLEEQLHTALEEVMPCVVCFGRACSDLCIGEGFTGEARQGDGKGRRGL